MPIIISIIIIIIIIIIAILQFKFLLRYQSNGSNNTNYRISFMSPNPPPLVAFLFPNVVTLRFLSLFRFLPRS